MLTNLFAFTKHSKLCSRIDYITIYHCSAL